jgi:transcriptional regulator with XRE-family HTH domain
MDKVGERLRAARERAGLSLREISARTKIRPPLLDAIERADFGQIPQGLLARGFLRAYAREVGLDPESVVRQFQDEYEPETTRPDASGEDAEPVDDQGPADVVPTVSSLESEADSLTIAIVPADVVWVEATADGTRVLYQLLHPGQQRSIDVRGELLLRVGDAGAFQHSINGVPGRQLGGPGTVRTLRITRENYSTFQD